jgi:hypothetical protein
MMIFGGSVRREVIIVRATEIISSGEERRENNKVLQQSGSIAAVWDQFTREITTAERYTVVVGVN